MTKGKPINLAASVRQRLLDLSRREGEDFQLVLTRYAIERLLFRLSQSRFRDQFIVKGAMLFQLWGGEPHRPTRDLDLLGQGSTETGRLVEVFREICSSQVQDDGLRFATDSVQAEEIKPDEEYQGIRVTLDCRLEQARIRLQIDIGFGDVVTPSPTEVAFPTVLDFSAPVLRVYPQETVIAEKLQAMAVLGIANSRMKDFFDIWHLANTFQFEGTVLCEAILQTFRRRQTAIPATLPTALTDEFAVDSAKQGQWQGFLRKGKLDEVPLQSVVSRLREFLAPVLIALQADGAFPFAWTPDVGWK